MREETGFGEAELESGEFAGEVLNCFGGFGGRDEDGVDAVDDAVSAELGWMLELGGGRGCDREGGGGREGTYDVDGDDPAEEVNCEAFEADVRAQALGLSADVLAV